MIVVDDTKKDNIMIMMTMLTLTLLLAATVTVMTITTTTVTTKWNKVVPSEKWLMDAKKLMMTTKMKS